MSENDTGWLWTDGHIVGNLEHWETLYNWTGKVHRTRENAQRIGLREYGSDDFNIAHIRNGVVDWWGWMDEPHDVADAAEFADQHGLSVAEVSS